MECARDDRFDDGTRGQQGGDALEERADRCSGRGYACRDHHAPRERAPFGCARVVEALLEAGDPAAENRHRMRNPVVEARRIADGGIQGERRQRDGEGV